MSALRVTTTTDAPAAEQELVSCIEKLGDSSPFIETITSFYWWEGKVQNDEERRLSFTTEAALDTVLEAIGKSHNYDVPMIIAEAIGKSHSSDASSAYWKGLIAQSDDTGLAERLAASRLVACAQVAPDGALAVKTTSKAKAAVEKLAPSVEWVPIVGNAPYMDWLDAETREAAEKACEAPAQ